MPCGDMTCLGVTRVACWPFPKHVLLPTCSALFTLLPIWNEYFRQVEAAEEAAFAQVNGALHQCNGNALHETAAAASHAQVGRHSAHCLGTAQVSMICCARVAVYIGSCHCLDRSVSSHKSRYDSLSQGLEPLEEWPPFPTEQLRPALHRSLWMSLRDLATLTVR